MTDPAPIPRNGSDTFSAGANVIDLRDGPPTRVRVSRDNNPFSHLSKQERMRLIVRVLCEIVAYGELDDAQTASDTPIQSDHPAING